MNVFEFFKDHPAGTNKLYAAPGGSNRTVLISSYIWWTELIAHALVRLGCNVLVAEPLFLFFTDDRRFEQFEEVYDFWVQSIRKYKVQLVIGGNTTVMVPHVKTKEMLHHAAGVPAVNYWWDEPRAMPPMTRKGYVSAGEYLEYLRDPRVLNVFWDADVMEEMERFFDLKNLAHVPLGTTPELWQRAYGPVVERSMRMCFLGNNHLEENWLAGQPPDVVAWAERVARLKLANLDRSTADCVAEVGKPGTAGQPYQLDTSLEREFQRWNLLGGMLLRDCRNRIVKAASEHLGDEFVLVGQGWDRLGLRAAKDHAGIPTSNVYYSGSQASMNLFGGCVHGGMPLRPYEICSSGGLLLTQYNRELPDLFEPGKECVAFRDAGEMIVAWERIRAAPTEYDAVVEAGRRRVIAEHTWEHRMARVLDLAKERFDLPW